MKNVLRLVMILCIALAGTAGEAAEIRTYLDRLMRECEAAAKASGLDLRRG